jgi:hypothetical protein
MVMTLPQPSDGFEWTQAPWGSALRCRPLLAVADHLFTARDLRLRDDPAEWARVADRVGVPAPRLLLIRQGSPQRRGDCAEGSHAAIG